MSKRIEVLTNKKVRKLINLILPKTNAKEELKYLHYNKKLNRLEATDSMAMVIIEYPNMEQNFKNSMVAFRESKDKLLYIELDGKYPELERVNPRDEDIKKIDSFAELIRYDNGKTRANIEDSLIYSQLMQVNEIDSKAEYGITKSGIFVIKARATNELTIRFILMGYQIIE